MLDLLRDLWTLMKAEKKFWLAPVVIVLLAIGVLVVLTVLYRGAVHMESVLIGCLNSKNKGSMTSS